MYIHIAQSSEIMFQLNDSIEASVNAIYCTEFFLIVYHKNYIMANVSKYSGENRGNINATYIHISVDNVILHDFLLLVSTFTMLN